MKPEPVEILTNNGCSTLFVSNYRSCGDRKLDQIAAMGDPAHMVQIGRRHCLCTDDGQRCAAAQRRMGARRVVVILELGQLPFQVASIPKRYVVEKFSPDRPDQALHEWV